MRTTHSNVFLLGGIALEYISGYLNIVQWKPKSTLLDRTAMVSNRIITAGVDGMANPRWRAVKGCSQGGVFYGGFPRNQI